MTKRFEYGCDICSPTSPSDNKEHAVVHETIYNRGFRVETEVSTQRFYPELCFGKSALLTPQRAKPAREMR